VCVVPLLPHLPMSDSRLPKSTPSTASAVPTCADGVSVPPPPDAWRQPLQPPGQEQRSTAAAAELQALLGRIEQLEPMLGEADIRETSQRLVHTMRAANNSRHGEDATSALRPERLPYTHQEGVLDSSQCTCGANAAAADDQHSDSDRGDDDGGSVRGLGAGSAPPSEGERESGDEDEENGVAFAEGHVDLAMLCAKLDKNKNVLTRYTVGYSQRTRR